MPIVKMPAIRAKMCANALVWLEVGDWANCPRPQLPLSSDEQSALAKRLSDAYWRQLETTRNLDEVRTAGQTVIPVVLSNSELRSVIRALMAVLVELADDPVEMEVVMSEGEDVRHVQELVTFLTGILASDPDDRSGYARASIE